MLPPPFSSPPPPPPLTVGFIGSVIGAMALSIGTTIGALVSSTAGGLVAAGGRGGGGGGESLSSL